MDLKHPTPQEAIVARFNDFSLSMKLLLDNRHTLPALILLFSAVDAFASLMRPETEDDTNGSHFEKWVENYMIGPSRLTITSDDLWGARCGLLHTHSPSSKHSRLTKAREIAYYREHEPTADMRRTLEFTLKSVRMRGKLPVNVDVLYGAFADGVRRFLADIHRDPGLEKRALHHSSKLFGVLNYVANR